MISDEESRYSISNSFNFLLIFIWLDYYLREELHEITLLTKPTRNNVFEHVSVRLSPPISVSSRTMEFVSGIRFILALVQARESSEKEGRKEGRNIRQTIWRLP